MPLLNCANIRSLPSVLKTETDRRSISISLSLYTLVVMVILALHSIVFWGHKSGCVCSFKVTEMLWRQM